MLFLSFSSSSSSSVFGLRCELDREQARVRAVQLEEPSDSAESSVFLLLMAPRCFSSSSSSSSSLCLCPPLHPFLPYIPPPPPCFPCLGGFHPPPKQTRHPRPIKTRPSSNKQPVSTLALFFSLLLLLYSPHPSSATGSYVGGMSEPWDVFALWNFCNSDSQAEFMGF